MAVINSNEIENVNSEIKYKSKFVLTPFVVFSFGILFGGITGISMFRAIISGSLAIGFVLFPLIFIVWSLWSLYSLGTIKKLIITDQHLILKYIFLNQTVKIKWSTISEIKEKFTTTKTGFDDFNYDTGSEIKISSNSREYNLHSIFYSNITFYHSRHLSS